MKIVSFVLSPECIEIWLLIYGDGSTKRSKSERFDRADRFSLYIFLVCDQHFFFEQSHYSYSFINTFVLTNDGYILFSGHTFRAVDIMNQAGAFWPLCRSSSGRFLVREIYLRYHFANISSKSTAFVSLDTHHAKVYPTLSEHLNTSYQFISVGALSKKLSCQFIYIIPFETSYGNSKRFTTDVSESTFLKTFLSLSHHVPAVAVMSWLKLQRN